MKKNFLFAAVALAAMTSCSNDEVVNVNNGDAISFRASLDKAISRGAETTVQNLGAFNVTAVGNGKNYFTNLAVTSDDQGSSWKTGSTYYWPGFQLNFFAYAPQNVKENVTISNTEKVITTFSPDQVVADQKDLVIACNTGTKAQNESTGVPLNFKHALSQIEIKALCGNPNIKVEVLGVRIVNTATSAKFTFPEEETNVNYTLPMEKWSEWSGQNEPSKAYMVKGNSPITLKKEAQSIMFGDDNFMLLPQQLVAWKNNTDKGGVYLSVMCRIYNVDGKNEMLLYPLATEQDAKTDKYGFSAVAIDTKWEPGKKYTYTLKFCENGGGAGRIDPNPDSTPDPNVDLNPIPDGNGGDLILGAPIKFTVSVENWTPVSVDVTMN